MAPSPRHQLGRTRRSHVVPVSVDLAKECDRVIEAAKAVGVVPGLVVVDTLSQTFDGEENSAAARWRPTCAAWAPGSVTRGAARAGDPPQRAHGHRERHAAAARSGYNVVSCSGCHRDEGDAGHAVQREAGDGELAINQMFAMTVFGWPR